MCVELAEVARLVDFHDLELPDVQVQFRDHGILRGSHSTIGGFPSSCCFSMVGWSTIDCKHANTGGYLDRYVLTCLNLCSQLKTSLSNILGAIKGTNALLNSQGNLMLMLYAMPSLGPHECLTKELADDWGHAQLEPLLAMIQRAAALGYFKPDPLIPISIQPSQEIFENYLKHAWSEQQRHRLH